MNSPIRYRNMLVQVLLALVTCGLYTIYWFYVSNREMSDYLKREEPVFLWTLLLFVPLIAFYSHYKQGELFERISPDVNRWLIFALWIVFPPAVWAIIQSKLNRIARSLPAPDSQVALPG